MWLAAKDSTDGALKFVAQSSVNAVGNLSMQGVISAGGKIVVKADDSAGGDLSGTFPSTLTVAKIQGYAVQAHAPLNGEVLIWSSGSSQYEPGTPSSTGIANPVTKATNDILQYNGSSWDAVGAAVGDPVTGPLYTGAITLVGSVNQLWNTDGGGNIGAVGATRPDKVYAKTSIWQGANQVLDTSMTLAGDVSGGYGTNTVDKIKNVSVLAGVPSDRQMFTYDSTGVRWEAQWPGMTNFSENRTFTILPAGSTVAQINTALTDYDVVYLEPGAYTHAGGASVLTIPQGKKLIGLGDIRPKSSSCGVVFSLTAASTASRYFYLQDGEIQNIYIEIAAAFVATTPIIEGDTTNYRNVVIGVGVRQLLGAVLAQYAFYGSFVKIERWTVVDLNGLYLLFAGVAYDEIPSYVSINSFYISGSPGYGLRIGTGVKTYICNGYINVSSGGYGLYSYTTSSTSVYVEAVYSFGTAGGLYFDVSAGNSANVTLVGCIGSASGASSGVYINRGNYCFISDTLGTGGGTGYGFRIENGVQVSLVNCRSSSSPYGFYFNAVTYFSVADSFTSSNTTGFYATGSKGQISSCSTDVCTTGFDITTGCTQVHLTNCRANGGTTGFNFGAPAGVVEQITAKGCTASGCAGNGFFFGTAAGANYLWNSVIADCYAYNCGATTANSSGFYGWLTRSSMTGCLAHSCNAQSGNRSFRLTFIYCTMTGCTGSDATYRNFDFEGGYGNAISGISSWGTTNTPDTNAYGIALSCTYTSMTGWSSYQDFRGVYIGGQNNTISSGNIYNSTDLGFFSANGLAYEAFHDIHVYNCGSHNFYFDNLQQSNVTGLTSEFGSGVGIYFFGTTTDVNISSCFVRGGTTYSFYMAAPNFCNVTGITCCYGATHFRIDGGNFSNFTGIHCFSGTEGIWFNAGTGHLLSASLSTGHSAATNRGIYLRGGNTNYEHGNKALGNNVPRDAGNNWTVIDAM